MPSFASLLTKSVALAVVLGILNCDDEGMNGPICARGEYRCNRNNNLTLCNDALTSLDPVLGEKCVPATCHGTYEGCTGKYCAAPTTACGSACFNLSNDPKNCGECGKVCPGSQACESGVCKCLGTTPNACPSGCVALLSDKNNCGACGNVCGSDLSCDKGVCTPSCMAGLTSPQTCGGKCVDLATDEANCGQCDRSCGEAACSGGKCDCGGKTLCGGKCLDTKTNVLNCGDCGATCKGDETCEGGLCKAKPPVCGDGKKNGTEECEGDYLGTETCSSRLGKPAEGQLKCSSECKFDTSTCNALPSCGDNKKDSGEGCDGADLGGTTCEVLLPGFAGALSCKPDCTFDDSQCFRTATCGSNTVTCSHKMDLPTCVQNECCAYLDLGPWKSTKLLGTVQWKFEFVSCGLNGITGQGDGYSLTGDSDPGGKIKMKITFGSTGQTTTATLTMIEFGKRFVLDLDGPCEDLKDQDEFFRDP